MVHPKLNNPPIEEALIDVRVRARPDVTSEQLQAIFDSVADQLPKKEALRTMRARIRLESTQELVQRSSSDNGWLFKSADDLILLQCRLDGMTLNRLRPYSGFVDLFERFRAYWQVYRDVARPQLVTRLALRYINRFQVPAEGVVADYLKYAPGQLSSDLFTTGFTQTTTHAYRDWNGRVNLTTALAPSLHDSATSMIVDIDAYCEDGFADKDLEECFQRLHSAKNEIFFAVVGDRALESFK